MTSVSSTMPALIVLALSGCIQSVESSERLLTLEELTIVNADRVTGGMKAAAAVPCSARMVNGIAGDLASSLIVPVPGFLLTPEVTWMQPSSEGLPFVSDGNLTSEMMYVAFHRVRVSSDVVFECGGAQLAEALYVDRIASRHNIADRTEPDIDDVERFVSLHETASTFEVVDIRYDPSNRED